MSTVTITNARGLFGETELRVRFSYDPKLVEFIKTIPSYDRSYDPSSKTWTVDTGRLDELARGFVELGATVLVDGKTWRGRDRDSSSSTEGSNPFASLFAALPDHLHEPTYKALLRVVHPDIGGDTVLTQQLNAARPSRAASA